MSRAGRPLLVPGLVVLIAAGALTLGALVPRDLSLGEDAPVWTTGGDLLAFDVSRGITAIVLFASAALVTVSVIREGFPRAGLPLWLSFLAFAFTNFALPGVAAREPGLDHRLLYAPLLFTAVYFARPVTTDGLVRLAKGACLAFVYASLVAAAVSPAQAVAAGYAGLVPGLDFRLYGIGGGATSLGLLSSAYLAVELVSPSPSRSRWLHLAAAAAALALTQAKTSWLFVLLVLAVWSHRRLRPRLASLLAGAGASARAAATLLLLCAGAAAAAAAARAALRVDVSSLAAGENLVTLTGRTYIWATSLGAWLESPVFGYGLGLWESEAFRSQHGPFDHAHNQFLHSLASAGVLGLLGLLAYLGHAFAAALRMARTTPAPLVLLSALAFLGLTNVPLRSYQVLDAFLLLHLLVFAFLVHERRRPQPHALDEGGARAAGPAEQPAC